MDLLEGFKKSKENNHIINSNTFGGLEGEDSGADYSRQEYQQNIPNG